MTKSCAVVWFSGDASVVMVVVVVGGVWSPFPVFSCVDLTIGKGARRCVQVLDLRRGGFWCPIIHRTF